MTTYIFAAAPTNASDAAFRAWGGGLSAAFAAVGMVKTADTGQINWITVTAPVSGSTYMGYEVWRFNDSLQGTYPLYFKIEYGCATSATNPSWRWTIGKGSDGTGTITGVLQAATVIAAGTATSGIYNWYVSSGDGSMLAIAPAANLYTGGGPTSTWYLVLERSRSTAGAATGTGLLVVEGSSGGAIPNTRQYNYALTTGITVYNGFPVGIPYPITTSPGISYGGIIPMFPGICADGAGNYWQPRSILVGHKDDIGQLNKVSTPWGDYLPITGMLAFGASGATYSRAAIAWY